MTTDFAGGSISSEGGLISVSAAEDKLGAGEALDGCVRDWGDLERVVHGLPVKMGFRMAMTPCGYEDADDHDAVREDLLV